jgi:endonuclease III
MKVKQTVNITFEPEEKEIVKKFNLLISDLCRNLRSDCELCPIKKQCNQIGKAITTLETL